MEYNSSISVGNINIRYNDMSDEIKISEFVLNIKNYIIKNFNYVSSVNSDNQVINFTQKTIRSISLKKHLHRLYIQTNITKTFKDYKKYITKGEFEFLVDFFVEMDAKFLDKDNKDDENEICDIIDPVKIDAKKYNL